MANRLYHAWQYKHTTSGQVSGQAIGNIALAQLLCYIQDAHSETGACGELATDTCNDAGHQPPAAAAAAQKAVSANAGCKLPCTGSAVEGR